MPERVDVLVVGAGPSGMAAALAAAEAGARTAVIDDNSAGGGQIWRRDRSGEHAEVVAWRQRAHAAGLLLWADATLIHLDGPRRALVQRDDQVDAIDCGALVLATGARELFLPFPGWDLPGVCGAGGLQALAKGGWPVEGARVLVAGTGPLLLAVAAYLRGKGARVLAVVEQAPRRAIARVGLSLLAHPVKLRQAVTLAGRLFGVPLWHSSWPVRAEGDDRLRTVSLRRGSGERTVEVDHLACGFGLVPQSGVAGFLGCARSASAVIVDDRQQTSIDGVYAAGEITGIGGLDLAVAEGAVAGAAAAGGNVSAVALRRRDRERVFAATLERSYELRSELRRLADDQTIVCRCEDVAYGEMRRCRDAREAKLETRCGMGPCQGRVCGPSSRFLFGWDEDRVRPPFYPVPLGTLAAARAAPAAIAGGLAADVGRLDR